MFCWFVCQKDCTKTTGQSCMKLGLRLGLGPDETPLSFHVNLDKGADAETFFLTYFYIVRLGSFSY